MTQYWTRWLHVYTSMIALLLTLFFGATGITLNHPGWTFGLEPETSTYEGVVPGEWRRSDDAVDFLAVSEHLRSGYDVRGEVVDYGTDVSDGYISYRAPGYAADVFFDLTSGEYRLSVETQGFVGVLNDLHKGRDSGSAWGWLIDASGLFLVLIAVTGLGLQLILPKRRRAALTTAAVGATAAALLTLVAVR